MISIAIQKKLDGADGEMLLDVDIRLKEGEFIALSGLSGSGKTTFLRILAGLEEAKGQIVVSGKKWLDEKYILPPQKREIGFVFQDYALFPHISVLDNLLYVTKDKALAMHLLEMTALVGLKDKYPPMLSGGQQQRVSLCRAMMNRPKLLLLDEPLSALDPLMREKLQREILILHQEFGTTSIMVSHDPSEMYRLATRALVMKEGKIVKDGSTKEVLLETDGSQKFSFEGVLLDIIQVDVIFVAIVSIGQQLVEVVVSSQEASQLQVGEKVRVSTKAFAPAIKPLS